jgi:hypothetical protein
MTDQTTIGSTAIPGMNYRNALGSGMIMLGSVNDKCLIVT